jgi:IclR family pca regulon transcriptional regulator
VIAALASSTSSGRSTQEAVREKIVPLLLRAATRISADLGDSSGSSARSVTNTAHEGFY